MGLRLGDDAPNFTAETTEGTINFHEWLGGGWGILFSHPKDYTPVCTTELGYMARIKGEFDKRGVKVLAISVDPLDSHRGWTKDINETQNWAYLMLLVRPGMIKFPKSGLKAGSSQPLLARNL